MLQSTTVATAAAHALLYTSTIEPNRDPPELGELMANAKKRPFARGLGRKIVHAHEQSETRRDAGGVRCSRRAGQIRVALMVMGEIGWRYLGYY